MMLVNAFGSGWIANASDIAGAVAALDPDQNSFMVLKTGEETYIQTAYEGGALVVEKREGSADRHFRAWHRGGGDSFAKRDVQRILESYVLGTEMPLTVEWKPHEFGIGGAGDLLKGFSLGKAALLLLLVAAAYFATDFVRGVLQ
jgi:hypothetical protein